VEGGDPEVSAGQNTLLCSLKSEVWGPPNQQDGERERERGRADGYLLSRGLSNPSFGVYKGGKRAGKHGGKKIEGGGRGRALIYNHRYWGLAYGKLFHVGGGHKVPRPTLE